MARATTPRTVAKARTLRQNLSLPETLLWRLLKGQPQGIKIRRQHPIGPYILDFYAPSAKLGIEMRAQPMTWVTAPPATRPARLGCTIRASPCSASPPPMC